MIEMLLSEQRINSLFVEKVLPKKLTWNVDRPCIVYTSEVFKNQTEVDKYLSQFSKKRN